MDLKLPLLPIYGLGMEFQSYHEMLNNMPELVHKYPYYTLFQNESFHMMIRMDSRNVKDIRKSPV